jgi:hypothetical protein
MEGNPRGHLPTDVASLDGGYREWKIIRYSGKYIKCVLPSLTEVVSPIMNLINRTHNFCERRKYVFNVLSEYIKLNSFISN